jgi:hypothetical protein
VRDHFDIVVPAVDIRFIFVHSFTPSHYVSHASACKQSRRLISPGRLVWSRLRASILTANSRPLALPAAALPWLSNAKSSDFHKQNLSFRLFVTRSLCIRCWFNHTVPLHRIKSPLLYLRFPISGRFSCDFSGSCLVAGSNWISISRSSSLWKIPLNKRFIVRTDSRSD